jgi:photosystem II stability/assembly factor-like uncharacterized protein
MRDAPDEVTAATDSGGNPLPRMDTRKPASLVSGEAEWPLQYRLAPQRRMPMRTIHWAVLLGSTVLLTGACKKSGRTGTGGGGGGAWLVGEDGLMENILPDGTLGNSYEPGADGNLNGITCRGADTAFVVGDNGTFLRTFDGGETWEAVDLGTIQALTDVASGAGAVFVAGDGVLQASYDDGDTWQALPGNGTGSWRSIATDHDGAVALLLRLDGSIWRWDATQGSMLEMTSMSGARSLSMSHDGLHAIAVGDGGALARSDDRGLTWTTVPTGIDVDLHAGWAAADGQLTAVGAAGTVVRVDAAGVEASAPGLGTLRAVHIDAAGQGIAAGEGGEVLTTSDGGDSWDVADVTLSGTVLGVDSVDGAGHD